MIIGLDIAKTTGIAIFDGEKVVITTFTGTPIDLLCYVESLIPQNSQIVIERHVHFLNANTTRSLIERLGYVKYSLIKSGHEVEDFFPGKGRKQLVEKYMAMGFTKDETDAMVLINFKIQDFKPFDYIKRLK